MNPVADDFELFGLARQFDQQPADLESRWKALQKQAHPDRFASQGQAAQRLSLQWSARINEAYQRLRDPVRRAAYLCERMGHPVEAENNTAMPADFLMQQMEWREALEEAATAVELDRLKTEVSGSRHNALLQVAHCLDERQDAAAAAGWVRRLMFLERFEQDVEQRLDRLEFSS